MKTRLVTGIVISALVHAGLFGTSLLGRKATTSDTLPVAPTDPIRPDQIIVEPLDPEPVVDPDATAPDDPPPVLPPRTPDRPEAPEPHRFTQEAQRPSPAGDFDMRNLTHIPTGPIGEIPRGAKIFDVGELKQKPAPRIQVAPRHPFDLRQAGIEGEVVVEFIVDADGRVQNAFVVRSTHRSFEAPALQAIAQWRFNPGRLEGRAVSTRRVQQVFTFTLNQ
ncbi:MAG TPA: TonB family protein [Opitutaceae bacterium]|nr:TonB family protein [Opitutaceae bacterium]